MQINRRELGLQLQRARVGKKQEEVVRDITALGVKMNQSRLSALENGRTKMTLDELVAFAKYFNKSWDYFLSVPLEKAAEEAEKKKTKAG